MNKPTFAYLVESGKVVEVITQEANGTFMIKLEERIYWVQEHEIKFIQQ